MITDHRFVRAAAALLGEAADTTASALAEGLIKNKAAFTDRFLRRGAKEVNGFKHHELRWRSKAFIDKEIDDDKQITDIVVILEIDLPDYQTRKGFLAQTLLMGSTASASSDEVALLRKRSSITQAVTPASFAFIYRPKGVVVVPAAALVASSTRPDRLHRRQVGPFFEEFFSCFIGDPKISGARTAPLEDLVKRHHARAGLALRVETISTPRQGRLFRT
jgi:hypothetical protein